MNQKNIKDTALKHAPKKRKGKHALIAFVSGGSLALFAQFLMMTYMQLFNLEEKSAITYCIVSIILIASILTGFGLYDKAAQQCGAGMFVPISGFANSLTSCAMEGKSEGLIYGIGGMMFKLAGSVLTYGVVSAAVFGTIRFLLFGG